MELFCDWLKAEKFSGACLLDLDFMIWIYFCNFFDSFQKKKDVFMIIDSTWFWDSIWKKPAVVGAQKMSSGSWVEEPLDLQCAGKDPLSIALFFFSSFFLLYSRLSKYVNRICAFVINFDDSRQDIFYVPVQKK